MNDWTAEFERFLDAIAKDAERALTDMARNFDEMVDAWIEDSEVALEQVEGVVNTLERHVTEMLDPILEAYLGFELDEHILLDDGFGLPEPPNVQRHPVCVGCQHYHGRTYNGNLLVCAMHPYGVEGDTCPDWEGSA